MDEDLKTRLCQAFFIWLIVSAFAASLLVTYPAFSGNHLSGLVGTKPNFTLSDLQGKQHRLSDYHGKVVIIDFWASWCAPCKEAMPFYESLKQIYKDDLVVLGISLDEKIGDAQKALKNKPYSFVFLHDKDGKVAAQFAVDTMPQSFFLDRSGKLQKSHSGFVKSERSVIERVVQRLVRHKP